MVNYSYSLPIIFEYTFRPSVKFQFHSDQLLRRFLLEIFLFYFLFSIVIKHLICMCFTIYCKLKQHYDIYVLLTHE